MSACSRSWRGFGLAAGNWLSLAACRIVPLASLVRRIHVEEAELERVLVDAYPAYEARDGAAPPGRLVSRRKPDLELHRCSRPSRASTNTASSFAATVPIHASMHSTRIDQMHSTPGRSTFTWPLVT
jgi:hypothetical protein